MQSFISNLTSFILGFLDYFVSTGSGRFFIIFGLVVFSLVFSFRYISR